MTRHRTFRAVTAAGTVTLVLAFVTAQIVLTIGDGTIIGHESWRAAAAAVFATVSAAVGALLVIRVPGNRIGWLLCIIGVAAASIEPTGFYAARGLAVAPGSLPFAVAAAWFSPEVAYIVVALVVTQLILLFPRGHLHGRGEVLAARVIGAYLVVSSLAAAVASLPRPGVAVTMDPSQHFTSILAADQIADSVRGFAFVGLLPCALASVVIMVRRFRRADGIERQQIKWFAYAGVVVLVAGFLPHLVSNAAGLAHDLVDATNAVFIGTLSLLPAAMAVAVLRYRLYEIDVVINRALVYGSLAVLITGVYVGIAVGIGELVGSGGKPNLGLSILATAVVAIGFQPARERLQRVANRLVYGKRATPYQVLSEFSHHVAGSYAADEVLPRMARVLQEGTGAEIARVWLRSDEHLNAAAAWPSDDTPVIPVTMLDGSLPALPAVTRAVEVRHQGELLGALTVTKRRGEALTPVEEKLLDDLAHQAGLVLKNVRLTADLQRRLEELRASRQRLVSAQDAERRRLERNLHDGAQQHLVALKVKLGLAEMLAGKDPEKARATLQQLKGDTDEALETLRDLARGIYPPLLAEKGLATALESQARKATLPVTVEADGVGRYPQEIEATVYFCVLEALQNVQKYADASHATVRLRDSDGVLWFDVEDDGQGFDIEHGRRGAGLTNMSDRLDAVGGTMTLRSTPGGGTAVGGALPVATVPVPAVAL